MTRAVETISDSVVACMATFPARYGNLASVVGSLSPQVDRVVIYSNQHDTDFPDLGGFGNVVVLKDADHAGDLVANGKIYPLKFLKNCYVFTVDDDFIYPPNYVRWKMRILDLFDRKCCVTTHGSIFPPTVRGYYERARVFQSKGALDALQLVTLGGSGTFGFHQSTLRVSVEDFLPDVMVDLAFALAARRSGLPIWAVPRPEGWLEPLRGRGLWENFRERLTHHTFVARQYDWSFDVYAPMARMAIDVAGARLVEAETEGLRIDPELLAALETGTPPSPWRLHRQSYTQRRKYYDTLNAALLAQENPETETADD